MSTEQERINAVADALHKFFHPDCEHKAPEKCFRLAKVAIAAADATRPKLEVTDAMAWSALCEWFQATDITREDEEIAAMKKVIEAALKEMQA